MRLSVSFFLFFSLLSLQLYAQDATIVYQDNIGGEGFEKASHILKTEERGFLILGSSNSNASGDKSENGKGNEDAWIVKLDENKNIAWEKTLGGSLDDALLSAYETEDGGFLITGWTQSSLSGDIDTEIRGDSDIWLLKLDVFGNLLWQQFIGGDGTDIALEISKTIDQNFLIAGTSNSNSSGDKTEDSLGEEDYWLIKVTPEGAILWQKTIGGASKDLLQSVKETQDEGIILMGTSNSNSSAMKSEDTIGTENLEDFWIVKLDAIGNILWDNTVGSNKEDILSSGIQTIEGGFLLTGYSKGHISGDKTEAVMGTFNRHDYWVVKIENNGNVSWDNTIGGNALDELYSVLEFSNGSFILAGHSNSDITGDKEENSVLFDLWFVQLDAGGTLITQSTLGGDAPEFLTSNILLNGNGTITTVAYGASEVSGDVVDPSNGGSDYWLIEIDGLLPLAIEENTIDPSIIITPNPANKYITIHHPDNNLQQVILYNVLGEKVVTYPLNTTKNIINIAMLSSGVYIAEIFVSNKTVLKKVIKQ